MNDICGMCEENPAVKTVSVQTMPGSFDTKFFDIRMCEKCTQQYQALLDSVWSNQEKNSNVE